MNPCKPTLLVLGIVPFLEHLHAFLHLGWKSNFGCLVGRPVTDGKDLNTKGQLGVRLLLHPRIKLALLLATHRQVIEHTLHLGGKLRPALNLQLGNHCLLCIITGRTLVQQSLRKLVPINLCKKILIGEE